MTYPRASAGMLRNHIRPASRAAAGFPRPLQQVRHKVEVRGPDDLGGPGGQMPPPEKPSGGPDVVKRNWIPIVGVSVALVGAYTMLTSRKPAKVTPADLTNRNSRATSSLGAKELKGLAESADAKSLKDMSGRNKDGMGGFRSE